MTGLEIYGLASVSIMLLAYAFEHRSNAWVLVFALSCFSSSLYAGLIQSLPFCGVEFIWGIVALRRWWKARNQSSKQS